MSIYQNMIYLQIQNDNDYQAQHLKEMSSPKHFYINKKNRF